MAYGPYLGVGHVYEGTCLLNETRIHIAMTVRHRSLNIMLGV